MLDESEALHHAVKTMQHGEVVVVFYEKLEPLQRVLEKYAAQPVQSISGLHGENRARRRSRLAHAHARRPMLPLAQAQRSTPHPQL